tara:strand:+ start:24627 stop:25271 length:645 start_codon:yes stop_codon:yes gene_type:complete
MKIKSKYAIALLLVVGVIVGPGYLIYNSKFSGKHVKNLEVYSQDLLTTNTGGVRLSQSLNESFQKRHLLKLDPSMNPIRLIARFRYHQNSVFNHRCSEYKAILYLGDKEVFSKGFTLIESKSKSEDSKQKPTSLSFERKTRSTKPVHTFSIYEPGTYEIELERKRKQEVSVTNMAIEVRRNVDKPNMLILVSGFSLLLLGVLLIFINHRAARPQ